VVEFQKAAEKSPPPRFFGPQIPLESIGLHNPQRPVSRPAGLFFQGISRMSVIDVEQIPFSITPGKRRARYPTLPRLDKITSPAVTAVAGRAWERRRVACRGAGS
jgi:hypothetical protein